LGKLILFTSGNDRSVHPERAYIAAATTQIPSNYNKRRRRDALSRMVKESVGLNKAISSKVKAKPLAKNLKTLDTRMSHQLIRMKNVF